MDNYRYLNIRNVFTECQFCKKYRLIVPKERNINSHNFLLLLMYKSMLLSRSASYNQFVTSNTKGITVKMTLSLFKYFLSLIRPNCPFICLSVHQSVNPNMNLLNRLIVHYAIKIQASLHTSCLDILQQIHSNYPHFRPRRNL